MKIKVQDIVYRANVREVRERVIHVADFSIPSDMIQASKATEAGQLLVSTGSGAWDVLGPPTVAGQYPAANLGLAKKWELVSPAANARIVVFCLNGATALTTSEKAMFRVPLAMNGLNLTAIYAHCGLDGSSGSSSSGIPTFTIQKGTQDMLSTNLTIDQGEYDSADAAAPAVIDTTHDDLATGDWITVEVVVSGTGVTYAEVVAVFA